MDSKKTGGGSVIFQSLKPLNATVLIGLSLNLEDYLGGKLLKTPRARCQVWGNCG